MRKIFEIKQPASGWSFSTKSVIGVVVEGLDLFVDILSGAHLHEAAFVALLNGPLSDHLKEAAKYRRVNPIRTQVERGFSGWKSFTIHWIEDMGRFVRPRKKEVLYISCHRKIAGVRLFLPDIIPFLDELDGTEAQEILAREVREVDRSLFHRFEPSQAVEKVKAFLEQYKPQIQEETA